MAKILLAEDDASLSTRISQSLSFDHYMVETAIDGEDANALLHERAYDMVILALELPKLTGLEICERYRDRGGKIPVLILSATKDVSYRVKGLNSGADDYMIKPFSLEELKARMRALLRRAYSERFSEYLFFQDVVLEPNNHVVTKSGYDLKLAPKEFRILELLMRYRGKVFSQEAITDRVWDQAENSESEAVRTYIMNLRRKLGSGIIKTVHGVGYKIPADIG